jgi:predicted neuraminidase
MVYNDLEDKRYSLAAAISDDEGITWKWRRHLDGDPTKPATSQYHYPSVIQAKDGIIHVTYSYFVPEGKAIKHVQIDENWVKTSPF